MYLCFLCCKSESFIVIYNIQIRRWQSERYVTSLAPAHIRIIIYSATKRSYRRDPLNLFRQYLKCVFFLIWTIWIIFNVCIRFYVANYLRCDKTDRARCLNFGCSQFKFWLFFYRIFYFLLIITHRIFSL